MDPGTKTSNTRGDAEGYQQDSGIHGMKRYPITEIFGPTIQGEGIDQGTPCYFVRFGGCDLRCVWCDTPYAVLPQAVKHAERLTEGDILDALLLLPRGPSLVVLSGGNPALHELGGLCERIHAQAMRISVETQGTRYKNWLLHADRLCLSPKPPSSEMKFNKVDFLDFLTRVIPTRSTSNGYGRVFVKVVIFDITDYEWAVDLFLAIKTTKIKLPFYLSAGNDAGKTVGNPTREDTRTLEQVRTDLLSKYLWLVNRTMVDQRFEGEVTVQCQSHVLAWGNQIGV